MVESIDLLVESIDNYKLLLYRFISFSMCNVYDKYTKID